jgi:hypothetical protein
MLPPLDMAPDAPRSVPLSAVSFLGGFRTRPAEYVAPSLKRSASEPHTQPGIASICGAADQLGLLRDQTLTDIDL